MPVLGGPITEEELGALGWRQILGDQVASTRRWDATSALYDEAKKLSEAGQEASAQALNLIGGAISMHLQYAAALPFGPMMQVGDRRTLSIEDIGSDDADLLGMAAMQTKNPWLRSRLGDVSISCQEPGRQQDWRLGKEVVAAYIDYVESVFLTEQAFDGIQECRRALRLFYPYCRKDEELWQRFWRIIESQIVDALERGQWGIAAALCDEVMDRHRVLCKPIAAIAEGAAERLKAAESFQNASWHFDYARRLWNRSGDSTSARRCEQGQGESLVSHALACSNGAQGLVASSFMLEGIQALQRSRAPVERIRELKEALAQLQLTSTDSFSGISHSTDITDVVKAVHDLVKGPTLFQALLQTAYVLTTWTNKEKMRSEVIESAKKYPFSKLFGAQHTDSKGAVIAVRKPLDVADENSLMEEMIVHARTFHMGFRARAIVIHAIEVLHNSFNPPFHSIKQVADSSPIVPQGFEETLARGLFHGICGDWIAAGVYLIPLAEPFVRSSLERHGVQTKIYREDGTQEEMPLSGLLKHPEAERVFGADMLFELRVLLVEPLGYNLRNDYCHGLMDDASLQSEGVLNLWWVLLRLTLFPWLETFAKDQKNENQPEHN